MRKTISPFTSTPGIAGNALIDTHFSDEIIMNFDSPESSKYVYKIVGLRGSGKSVEYSIVMNHFREEKGWLVYSLSAGGNPVQTLISGLGKERFINSKLIRQTIGGDASVEGGTAIISGAAGFKSEINIQENDHYYSDEAELKEMISKATKKGYRVLLGVDDIAKTDEMVRFLSILGDVIMEKGMDVRFICTGLWKNIEDFVNVPHISFFVRAESITVKPLDYHSMAQKYRQLLGIKHEEAVRLSQFTKGYAYAYQILGDACFRQSKSTIDDEIETEFDEDIGPQYDLIWQTLTDAEQKLVRIILEDESGAVSGIKEKMEQTSSFDSLRDRLKKKHIIVSPSRGTVEIPLPRFKEYVELWHSY
ncbi:MAG: hypothetical protein K6B14_07505 [Lachnospiraceae bacterium]|nr:hypothetical protein [Lachnospiraceae bacterium]